MKRKPPSKQQQLENIRNTQYNKACDQIHKLEIAMTGLPSVNDDGLVRLAATLNLAVQKYVLAKTALNMLVDVQAAAPKPPVAANF